MRDLAYWEINKLIDEGLRELENRGTSVACSRQPVPGIKGELLHWVKTAYEEGFHAGNTRGYSEGIRDGGE